MQNLTLNGLRGTQCRSAQRFGRQLVEQPFVLVCEAAKLGHSETSHNICSGRRFLCVQGATGEIELPQLQVTLWGYLQVTLERSEQSPIFDVRGVGEIFDEDIVRLPGHDVCERIADYFFS
jgi:hypothetical protein